MADRKKIGEILQNLGLVDEGDIEEALAIQEEDSRLLGEILVGLDKVSLDDLRWALAEQFQLPLVRLTPDQLDPEVSRLIPRDFAFRHQVVPIHKIGGQLALVLSDPREISQIEKLQNLLKPLSELQFTISLAPAEEVKEALVSIWGDEEVSSVDMVEGEVEDFTLDPSGEILLRELLSQADFQEAQTLYFDFTSQGAVVHLRKMVGMSRIATLNREWGEILEKRIMEDLSQEQVLTKKVGRENRSYRIWREEMVGRTTLVAREFLPHAHPWPLEVASVRREFNPTSRGVVWVFGSREYGEALVIDGLHSQAERESRIVAWAPQHTWESPKISWVQGSDDGRVPDQLQQLAPDVIYLEGEKSLARGVDLALEGYGVVLASFYPTLAKFLDRRPEFSMDGCSGVLEKVIEIFDCPELCLNCRQSVEVPLYLKEKVNRDITETYRAMGCAECSQLGYSGRLFTWGKWEPGSKLWQLFEAPREEVLARYRDLSPLYPSVKTWIAEGRISIFDCKYLFL